MMRPHAKEKKVVWLSQKKKKKYCIFNSQSPGAERGGYIFGISTSFALSVSDNVLRIISSSSIQSYWISGFYKDPVVSHKKNTKVQPHGLLSSFPTTTTTWYFVLFRCSYQQSSPFVWLCYIICTTQDQITAQSIHKIYQNFFFSFFVKSSLPFKQSIRFGVPSIFPSLFQRPTIFLTTPFPSPSFLCDCVRVSLREQDIGL